MKMFTDAVQSSLKKFLPAEEEREPELERVLDAMLSGLPQWIEMLRSGGIEIPEGKDRSEASAPELIIRKYEVTLSEIQGRKLPLKQRAKAAERMVREIMTSVEWYWRGDRQSLLDAKSEVLPVCKIARQILGGQKLSL